MIKQTLNLKKKTETKEEEDGPVSKRQEKQETDTQNKEMER